MNIEQVLRSYRTKINNSERLRKLAINPKTYRDVEAYAKGTGRELADALQKFAELESLSEEELFEVLDICLQTNHADVVKVAKKVQQRIYDAADIGIGVLEPDYDREAIKVLTESLIDGRESFDNLKNLVIKESLKNSDNMIIENSKAAGNMGLKTRIIRKYDGVGLRNGTKYAEPCEWCLARQGEWDDYGEAMAAGAFERHPGCGCYISYEVGKTRRWSTSAGQWIDM